MSAFKNDIFVEQCENMIEEFEDDISEWYYKHQEENLYRWLCGNRVLKGGQKNKGIHVLLLYNMGKSLMI